MIELVFVACLKTQPDLCEERTFSYTQEVNLFSCILHAQPQLAEWVDTHPHLTVARWTCQMSDRREVKA